MKLGTLIVAAFITLVLGLMFSPIFVAIWFVATHSLTDIIRFAVIAYLCLIPVSMFAQRN